MHDLETAHYDFEQQMPPLIDTGISQSAARAGPQINL